MPSYKVKDPQTGRSLTLKGDSVPTEQELNDVFSQFHDATRDAPADIQPSGQTPPPSTDFEVSGRSQPAMGSTPSYAPPVDPSYRPAPGISPTRALLTNEPTSGLAEDMIRGVPATLGGVVGATVGAGAASIPGAALGGAAGEGIRQNAVQLYAGATGRPMSTPGQVVGGMVTQGVLQGGGQALAVGAAALRPAANKLGAQVMRVGSGLPEKYGQAAMANPSALLNAPSKAEAGAAYTAFEKATGLHSLDDAVKGMGRFPSESEMEGVLFKAAKNASAGVKDPQELYLASQAASNLKQMGKMGNARYASLESAINQAKSTVDTALEAIHPEYGSLRQGWFDAKMGEQFSSLLPLNKNTSPNVLRAVTAGTTAAAGTMAGSPAALAALPLISPRFYGTAIKGAALAGKVPAGVYRLPLQSTASGAGASLADAYMRHRTAQ